MNPYAKLLREGVNDDGHYVGQFVAYGLQFTITYNGEWYTPLADPTNPKKPNWTVEAAVRLCQMAAHARVRALGLTTEE